ncbi:hypothetical protein E3P78_02917 [Wallemia ichthyophaga]|nr:hypothetical protein E3P78_02917 [Wallemia ichthyophaga]
MQHNKEIIEDSTTFPDKPIKRLVLDAAPLLTQAPIRGMAQEFYTTPHVIQELRDEKSKKHLEMLEIQGVHINVQQPDPISYAKVSSFSKLTGDYSVLSGPDMGILALTYALEVKENGTVRLRDAPGKSTAKKPVQNQITDPNSPSTSSPAIGDKLSEKIQNVTLDETPKGRQEQDQQDPRAQQPHQQPAEEEFTTVSKGMSIAAKPRRNKNTQSQDDFGSIQVDDKSEGEDESDDEDAGDWITPDNVEDHKAVDLGHQTIQEQSKKDRSKKPPVFLKAACMTADFAMQNVLIQIGLNLVGTNGQRIKSAKSWVLRCHACFKLCRDQSKRFCPACGNSTLLRTSITTYAPKSADAAPVVKVHLKKNFQYKNRGTKYSIPASRVGSSKTGSGLPLILREDDPDFQRSVHADQVAKRKEEKALMRSLEKGKAGTSGFTGQWMDPDWLPGLLAPDANARRTGGRGPARIGHGRRNPNEGCRMDYKPLESSRHFFIAGHQDPMKMEPPTSINSLELESKPVEGTRGRKKGPRRTQFSCTECHRRKQKCDRNHCAQRKVPCVPFQPGHDNDVHSRLVRVEGLVESLMPLLQTDTSGSTSEPPSKRRKAMSTATSGDDDDEERDDLANVGIGPAASGTLLNNGNWYGPSSLNVSEIAHDLADKVGGDTTTDFKNPAHSPIAVDDQLSIVIQEFGMSPSKVDTLVDELPPKQFADKLVDSFFAHINWTRYPIHEQSFRNAYESTYKKRRSLEAKDFKNLPLVFIVLATTLRFAPNEEIAVEAGSGLSEAERRSWALRLYWSSKPNYYCAHNKTPANTFSARRCSLLVSAVQGDCTEMVISRLLSTRLLINERRLTESWSQLGSAIRTAQSLGMHRDGSKLGLSCYETEYRRRIWSYLQHADNTLALILGRPPSIIPAYCDTLPPSNIDDNDFQSTSVDTSPPLPKPLNIPTLMTAHVLRHSFVQIVARCNEHFSNLRAPSSYSNVLRLDAEIGEFIARLPPVFRFEDPDTSVDSQMPWLPTHRFLLAVECYFTKISLHRPWVLRKLNSTRYAPSRRACFESAKLDFFARERFRKETNKSLGRFGGGQYRIFNSTLISAIALILEPFGKDSAQHKHILDSFLAERQDKTVTLPWDEAMVNEMRIIQLFRNKAQELRQSRAAATSSSGRGAKGRVNGEEVDGFDDTTADKDPSLRFAQPNANSNANLLMGMSNSSFAEASAPSYQSVVSGSDNVDAQWQWNSGGGGAGAGASTSAATSANHLQPPSIDVNGNNWTLNDAPADTIAMLLGLGVPDMMPLSGSLDNSRTCGEALNSSEALELEQSTNSFLAITMKLNLAIAASILGFAAAAPAERQTQGVVNSCYKPDSMAITYDDGPYQWDYNVNSQFNAVDGKTTYFVNGNNWSCIYSEENVSRLRALHENGHQIASHTWGHVHLPQLTNEQIDQQVQLVEDALWKIIGVVPKFIRPPYGEVDDRVVQHLQDRWGLTVVNWSEDSRDALGASDQEILDLYDGFASDTSQSHIVLNHAVHEPASHLPQVYVPEMQNAGYSLDTVAQCLYQEPYKVTGGYSQRDASWTCEGLPAPGEA